MAAARAPDRPALFEATMPPRLFAVAALCLSLNVVHAQAPQQGSELERAVAQLRGTVGRWNVTTHFLKPDGSVARSVEVSYEFTGVVPPDAFESRMEYTGDGGRTWRPGNHQLFRRAQPRPQ